MTELKIGADPELFLKDRKTGKLISAAGLFPGTKEEPFPVTHGAIQVDGMAAEYNIIPATNANQFVLHNLSVLRDLRDVIRKENPGLDFEFAFTPVAEFGKELIDAQPEEARRLGCTPDFNAYEDGGQNPVPDADMPFRTSSGHIHIGWGEDIDIEDPDHIEACCMMIKQLDVMLGIYLLEGEGKEGKKRRALYGKAGAFRPKKYGVEYRTPSDVWLKSTHAMAQAFKFSRSAYDNLIRGDRFYDFDGLYKDARALIDTGAYQKVNNYFGRAFSIPDISEVNVDNLDRLVDKYRRYDELGLFPKIEIPKIDLHPAAAMQFEEFAERFAAPAFQAAPLVAAVAAVHPWDVDAAIAGVDFGNAILDVDVEQDDDFGFADDDDELDLI